MATIQQATKNITRYGLARSNRFNVIIALPEILNLIMNEQQGEEQDNILKPYIGEFGVDLVKAYAGSGVEVVRGLDIMCDVSEIPGKSLTTSETKYNRDFINLPYGITYTPITFTFVVSRDFLEKNIIDQWMDLIINPDTQEVGYYQDFVSPSIEIQQLNEQDQTTHSIQLIDAYPSEVQSMPLENESENSFHKMSVTFIYRRWKNNKTEQPSGVTSLSQTPLGPLVTPILGNPVVQRGIDFVESQTGINLDGEAANIYNKVDEIVRNTTDSSINTSTSLLNGIKASVDVSGDITEEQKGQLLDIIDGTLSQLNR